MLRAGRGTCVNRLAPRTAMNGAPGQVLRPVVGMDLDGTAGYFHEHFCQYASMFLQREVQFAWDGSLPFWRSLGISKERYREIKLGYRQGRMKRSMAYIDGAPEFTRAVRQAGAELWVTTTRPWLRLDNIDPDTRFWLRHNGMQYDGVLFGENKYRDLAKLVGIGRVVAVLDDEPDQVRKAERHTVRGVAHLIDREYNQGEGYQRADNLWAASKLVVDRIHEWRKERGV